jgi:hypothetical protein
MASYLKPIALLSAGLLLIMGSEAALAVPIEVAYRSDDGSAFGTFAFEPREAQDNPGALTSGQFTIGDREFQGSQLFYEYFPIADSLSVRIAADATTGLATGDFLSLRFGNPDGASLNLPTRGSLSYSFGGAGGSLQGDVTAVPEPLAAGLFGLGAGALAWRRRRRGATQLPASAGALRPIGNG